MVEISAKIRPSLIALNVGDEISFPIEKLKSVRTQASELGAIMSRQYTTKTDRINHIIKVKRILYNQTIKIMFSIQFIDHEVPYDVFLNDLVNKLVQALKDTHDDPEFISQRKAYKLFGRRNVDRWRRQGKVVCYKRPGKVEYKTADLRMLQKTTQDYFESPPLSSITSIKKTVKHTK